MNKPAALLPNPVWQGLLPYLLVTGAGASVPAQGINYTFTATQLLIKNVDENKWYELWVAGNPNEEVLDFNTEQVAPVPAGAPQNSGTNYQFTADGYLRFKNLDTATYHTLDLATEPIDNEVVFNVAAGVASNAGVFAAQGNNYRFIGSTLQLYDSVSTLYHTIDIVGTSGVDASLEIL